MRRAPRAIRVRTSTLPPQQSLTSYSTTYVRQESKPLVGAYSLPICQDYCTEPLIPFIFRNNLYHPFIEA
eukprot:scaffold251535_cov15-Prasinocladus_malaysianus.AAC.1